MKSFRYFVFVLLVGIGILDLLYVLFRKGYNKFNMFEQSRMNEVFNGKDNFDILFAGSSRTYYHVNPAIIDSVMKLSSYNAGIDGANILETDLIVRGYLASHPAPKFIVVDLSWGAFYVNEAAIFNPNIYYPFLNNKTVFNTLKPYKHVYLLRYLPFLQITECDDFLRQGSIAGLTGKVKKLAPHYKGYLESTNDTIPLPFKSSYLTTYYPIYQKGTELLLDMINTCKRRNIQLIITYSPVYDLNDEKDNEAFFPTLKAICDSTGTLFFNYRTIPLTKNHRLFRDELHLNHKGADSFSHILAKDLQEVATGGKPKYAN